MIRAQMATFPARQGVVQEAVRSLLPQVDKLFIVFNEYESIPDWAQGDARIEAAIPDRDLKDAGKFYFSPDPDDLVLLVDDDILYPLDYTIQTIGRFKRVRRLSSCTGYFANVLSPHPTAGRVRWKTFIFREGMGRTRGASLLGTGTVCVLGRNVPPLEFMEDYIGLCDLGFSLWQLDNGCLPWVVPREKDWMRSVLPDDLRGASLYETVHKKQSRRQKTILRKLAEAWPHAGMPYRNFVRSAAARPYWVA